MWDQPVRKRSEFVYFSESRLELEDIARIVGKIQVGAGAELKIDLECLAAEINQRGARYLEGRREEKIRRPLSAVRYDLQRCASWLEKVIEWSKKGAHSRKKATGHKRVKNAITSARRVGGDPRLRALVGPPELAAGIRLLRRVEASIEVSSEIKYLERISELRSIILATDRRLYQSRRGKASHRRSGARVTFLNQLADLFVKYLGLAPTFTWSHYPEEEEEEGGEKDEEARSPFVLFVKEIFRIIEPEALRRERQLEADIQAAVGRKKGRRYENGELVIHVYEDPRDRNRRRGRIIR